MSTVIRSSKPAARPGFQPADHAGGRPRQEQPHRPLARHGRRRSPPRDCITCSGAGDAGARQPGFHVRQIAVDHRLDVGIEGGDAGALVFAERRDRPRDDSETGRSGTLALDDRRGRGCSCVGIEEREQEADRDRLHALADQLVDGALRTMASSSGISTSPVRVDALAHLLAQRPGARNTGVSGCRTRSYIWWRICRPISSTSLEAFGRDQADAARPCAPAPHWSRPSCRG